MSTLEIILVVLVCLMVLFFVGGLIAAGRRATAMEPQLQARLAAANEALAQAHAADKGWKRATIEKAARDAFRKTHQDASIDALHLVQVIDKPGVEADEAVFNVISGDRIHVVKLDRGSGQWRAVSDGAESI